MVATITEGNLTEKVTKGEVIIFASRYSFSPDEDPETIHRVSVDSLVNTKLLKMFLARQQIVVPPEKIDEQIERLKQQLKTEGQDLATTLLQNNISLEDVRKEYEGRLRWEFYLKPKATDAALRQYVADHRDLFSGTQLRASHILLKVEPNASDADKQKVKQKLGERQEGDRGRNDYLRGRGQQVFGRSRQYRRRGGATWVASLSVRDWSRNSPTSPSN